jgi:hypothetical protein
MSIDSRYYTIDTYIHDLIFRKYGAEEEDFKYSLELLNEKEKQRVLELEENIREMMGVMVQD